MFLRDACHPFNELGDMLLSHTIDYCIKVAFVGDVSESILPYRVLHHSLSHPSVSRTSEHSFNQVGFDREARHILLLRASFYLHYTF